MISYKSLILGICQKPNAPWKKSFFTIWIISSNSVLLLYLLVLKREQSEKGLDILYETLIYFIKITLLHCKFPLFTFNLCKVSVS